MVMKPRISKDQYELLASFRYALRRFLHFSETAANAAGITPQHHQALLAIKGFPGRDSVRVGELAERLQIRHHSAVGLVDRLVTEKLVRREQSTGDHRQVMVRLTLHGEHVLEKLSELHHIQLKTLGPELRRMLARLSKL